MIPTRSQVDEAKGDYPQLQTSVFIQLLLETDGSAGSVATPDFRLRCGMFVWCDLCVNTINVIAKYHK